MFNATFTWPHEPPCKYWNIERNWRPPQTPSAANRQWSIKVKKDLKSCFLLLAFSKRFTLCTLNGRSRNTTAASTTWRPPAALSTSTAPTRRPSRLFCPRWLRTTQNYAAELIFLMPAMGHIFPWLPCYENSPARVVTGKFSLQCDPIGTSFPWCSESEVKTSKYTLESWITGPAV